MPGRNRQADARGVDPDVAAAVAMEARPAADRVSLPQLRRQGGAAGELHGTAGPVPLVRHDPGAEDELGPLRPAVMVLRQRLLQLPDRRRYRHPTSYWHSTD